MKDLPLWVRKALVDFIEGAIASVVVLNIVIPGTLEEAQAQGAIIGAAIATAAVAAARRARPDFVAWLKTVFATTE